MTTTFRKIIIGASAACILAVSASPAVAQPKDPIEKPCITKPHQPPVCP